MPKRFLKFDNVSFAYPGMPDPLLDGVDAYFPEGSWTGIVGANGCGKTTLLKLAAGELEPSSGGISSFGTARNVAQRTDFPPEDLEDFIYAADPDAITWKRRLAIGDDWADRWDTLSHGERKRAQIATALWSAPEVLALDEPTNHLDASAKSLLLEALRAFRGAGFIVSHDRDFLDALCSQCLFIFPPAATMRPGGVTQGMEEDKKEQDFNRQRDKSARTKARNLKEAAQARLELAEQLAAKNKAARNRKISANDHDGREKRNIAKLTGKNSWAVGQSSALAKRAGKAEAERAGYKPRKEYEMGFWIDPGEKSSRNCLISLEAGSMPIGDGGRILEYPELRVGPDDRIAITGDNGLGKSTLLRHLLSIANVESGKLLSIPQEIPEEESRRIHAELKECGSEKLGKIMTSVSRLGSRPGRLLESVSPSPGEIRKILLATGVVSGLHLLAMDEPTNHLDLPSIECLEDALDEFPGALIIVSHDERFISRLAEIRWHLVKTSPKAATLEIK